MQHPLLRLCVGLWIAGVAGAVGPASARAEVNPAGALTGHGLVADEAWGAGLLVDVTVPVGAFRIGGALGLAALSSRNASRSRVFMPGGVSVGWTWPLTGSVGAGPVLDLRMRAGGWAGARDDGLGAGAWLAPGAYFGYFLGPQVAAGIGLDGWFLLADGDTAVIAPGLTLTWIPS